MLTGGASSHQIGVFLIKTLLSTLRVLPGPICGSGPGLSIMDPPDRADAGSIDLCLYSLAICHRRTQWNGTMQVIVVGAGIGGLTLGLMLHARGIPCRIYEAAPKIRELGVGINVLPHAIAELAELGLLERLDAVAIRTRELIYANRFGQEIWREPRGLEAGYRVPQFSIHRGHLQGALRDAAIERLGRKAIHTGHAFSSFTQEEGGVKARF